ncbi:MAG: hypothetical protein IT364_23980 [Candidatus Hydrogenedentes bacterium]|nr:hypothetical protein [Candidatus Hydrogenedentota bacterium]
MRAVFHQLSASEKRLAIIAGLCLVVAILFIGYIRAMDRLDAMDATIDSLQQQLLAYTELVQQADSVNAAFEAMAQQHSSKWTQEEIHDSLRREIARLALRNIPPPGSPAPASTDPAAMLVNIPQMPMGTLMDSEEGYRSYQINVKTEAAPIQNITTFLERLQRSDQALRVESLEIIRQPLANVATANIRVTRTIIDDEVDAGQAASPPESGAASVRLLNPSVEEWEAADQCTGWTAEECIVSQHTEQVTEGHSSMRAESTGPEGRVYQAVALIPGRTYELTVDAIAMGSARLEIADDAGNHPYVGTQPLTQGDTPYRYRVRFTVEDQGTESVSIRAPQLVIEGTGSVVLLDNVSLAEVPAGP